MNIRATVGQLINEGAIYAKGEGHADDRQWLLIHTTGVVYKEFWTGPGLAVDTEISTDANLSEEALEVISEAAGVFWNENNQQIEEPPTRRKVLTF
jgi:hypothetical protein